MPKYGPKILLAFSLFNFIKALTHNIMLKNDGVFKVQFYKTCLGLKMPKWMTKMPKRGKIHKLATCCSTFVAKREAF